MKALTVKPGTPGSARVEEVPDPPTSDGPVLVETLAIGICGTDQEIVSGAYGWAPPGRDRLVLGHESIGRVVDAPPETSLRPGQLVVGIVRRPDPVPCPNCAAGEWDFCRNGRYTERGIKEHDGYCSERYRITPDFLVPVADDLGHLGVLLEPTSVVAKAWEQIDRVGGRATFRPERVLVTGAGPIGLLAALIGVQRGLEVHVLDRVESGRKPELVAGLGATYHHGDLSEVGPVDAVVECTGVGPLIFGAAGLLTGGGVLCLTGVSSGGHQIPIDAGSVNRTMVLENEAIVGSVNANRRHYQAAADALAKADRSWLAGLVSRRVPLAEFADALAHRDDDVKVVVQLAG